MAKNYYKTLGLAKTATPEEIKKAYRQLARQFHPDINKAADAERRMQEINIAYAVVSDIEKRKQYDAAYSDVVQFDTASSWQNDESLHRPIRGEDQYRRLTVDLATAFYGTTAQIDLHMPVHNAFGQTEIQQMRVDIIIPKGIPQGQQIRITGLGKPGINGGENGDLYLEIYYRHADHITIHEADLFIQVNVSPWQAALGNTIPVTLPDGTNITLKMPQNTCEGQQIRLKQKGIPSNPAGDVYLCFHLVYPPVHNKNCIAYQHFAESLCSF